MSPLIEIQRSIREARSEQLAAGQALEAGRNRLRALDASLEEAMRRGREGERAEAELRERVAAARAEVAAHAAAVASARAGLLDRLDSPRLDRPQALVEELDDAIPFLLLPVRVETRFMPVDGKTELWVRLFPDDVAVHSHEASLTVDEAEAGRTYWREAWAAEQEDPDRKRELLEGAWRALAGETGGTRAAWVARRTRPGNLDAGEADDLQFPTFEPEDLRAESWSEPPRVKVLPDRFVVMTFSNGARIHEVIGAPIPDPLLIGPDPQALEADLAREEGELVAGKEIAWIYDFREAEKVGMGVRIPLEESHASGGFDRILVLGLKLSASAEEAARLVEELIENHHYAPDGMSLLPQGVPTNNTAAARAGFSSVDPRGETGLDVELGDPLFDPADDADATDARRLVEALGIDHRPLQQLRFADREDVHEAQAMNRALWPATLGYFLEEMLGLELGTVRRVRRFFLDHVTARGPLPALRVATQPYGVLITSALPQWEWSAGERDGVFLDELTGILRKLDAEWTRLLPQAARVGAPGDPFENLLRTIGLDAASVEFHRRHAVGPDYIWNYQGFLGQARAAQAVRRHLVERARQLREELGVEFDPPPRIFDLAFFQRQNRITDPLIADVASQADERWSETEGLAALYSTPGVEGLNNYIGWLLRSAIDDIKRQRFRDSENQTLSVPRPLLYRLLQGALLLAYHDASMNIYVERGVVGPVARKELELPNVRSDRTVTRWEFMEAKARAVLPGLTQEDLTVVQFLQTSEGLARPEAADLNEARAGLEVLESLPTARLERLLAEHLDLCGYRLDAWQTALFARRLEHMRFPRGRRRFDDRVTGLYLGSFGWLEDLRPRPPAPVVNDEDVPEALREPEKGPITEQPGNGGFIHGSSLNHAVAAAVLRNAYVTHASPGKPQAMSVNLSSDRVRRALGVLDAIRAGQELGAVLGYQFERGMHDRRPDLALDQYILAFRQRYPLLADKVTEDEEGAEVELKEPRNVVDGYALVEVAFLADPPTPYPYGVAGLPGAGSQAGRAIRTEVDRLHETADAVADLALAEGVFQVVQGNYDRAGAVLKALAEGSSPPEPEIAITPRSGAAIGHRVTVHVETGDAIEPPWATVLTPRARAEPGVNEWLGRMIGPPDRIRYIVSFTNPPGRDANNSLADLEVQPIDLIHLLVDEVDPRGGEGSRDDTTELERRIAYAFRRRKRDEGNADIGDVRIQFIERDPGWGADDTTLFEMLPLLRGLRDLVNGSRPMGAHDYMLPSEVVTDPGQDPNPREWDEADSRDRLETAIAELGQAIGALETAIGAAEAADATDAELEPLRSALVAVARYGVPDAFPRDAVGSSEDPRQGLLQQAHGVRDAAESRRARAEPLKDLAHLEPEEAAALTLEDRIEIYREAAREILGSAFNFLPRFAFRNPGEVGSAAAFGERADGLTRFSEDPLIAEEWLQGVARVRGRMDLLETVCTLHSAFSRTDLALKPLQLPYRETDHWVAGPYPEVNPEDQDDPTVFEPEGEFLSVVRLLPPSGLDLAAVQCGFLVDEWSEVIPGKVATTGIAYHYDQPGSEPPQALLLAVAPRLTGKWSWDDLVAILEDTLERAKKRAIEPDMLGATAFAQMLPAILTAVTTYPYATLSTDLLHQTAIHATALARDIDGD